MAACLKHLKSIKQDIRFTVFGYVRQNEDKLTLFCNVPSMICYLCLSYYYHGECFEKAGDDLKISNDKTTVEKVANGMFDVNFRNTSYGKTWIDSSINQIVEWKFKINTINNGIYICLVSKDNRLNRDCNTRADAPNFGFSNYGDIIMYGGEVANDGRKVVKRFYENDEISMIVNTKDGEIYLQRNGGIKALMVKNIKRGDDIKYKMAVSIRKYLDSVTLLDFKCDLL